MTARELLNLALSKHQAGEVAEAERLYREILQQEPNQPDALYYLGVVCVQFRRHAEAVQWLQRAIALRPNLAEYHINLGIALEGSGRSADAIAAFGRAAQLQPNLPEAHGNLGKAMLEANRLDEAIIECHRAIALRQDYFNAQLNLASALYKKGESAAALEFSRRALELRPNDVGALGVHGSVLRDQQRLDEALEAYRRAVELQPNFAPALLNLGGALHEAGLLDEALKCFDKASQIKPDDAEIASIRVIVLQRHPGYDAGAQLENTRKWNERFAKPLAGEIQLHSNNRDPQRRLRIGYLSPDFRRHVVAHNLLPLFREHDPRAVQIFMYSSVRRADDLTQRIKLCADVWREVLDLSDAQCAAQIRADKTDILVDLSLHTAANRLLVMARKPAPVQVSFAAYPGGPGLDAIDWRLTDPYLDPPEKEGDFLEKPWRLPHSFWCYDREYLNTGQPPPLPASKNGYITFGCLNDFTKLNSGVLTVWDRVLQAVPRSRLRMRAPPGHTREALAARWGADRVDFVGRLPRDQYMAEFNHIDIGLDTWPYNGHTTTLDALWMGVPVVSGIGRTIYGRAGLSMMTNLKLTELVAAGDGEFVKIAMELAADLPRLADLRQTLRKRMEESPLTNARGFARAIEQAYRQMWQNWIDKKTQA